MAPARRASPPAAAADEPVGWFLEKLDANATVVVAPGASPEESARRLGVLFRMSREFTAEKSLDVFAQLVVTRLMESFPKATRGSFVVSDPSTGALLLKYGTSPDNPGLSQTLARRALDESRGFIYERTAEDPSASASITEFNISCAMYAPLLWQEQKLGVLCVDDQRTRRSVFGEDDLRLFVAVAQMAAPALANHNLQKDVAREGQVRANLLRQFSPKVAQRLLSHRGRIRLGGTRGWVTILCSDIRGFTRTARDMEPDDVVDLLNAYFARLVPILFAHGGTVDKFVGDAILAVFDSTDADPDQYRSAVRAAGKMQAAVRELNARRAAAGHVCCGVGIGIHCGEVIHGFVGSADLMQFTVIGDAVNAASRYCAGARDGEILISPEVYEHAWKVVKAQMDYVKTKDNEQLKVFRVAEVIGNAGGGRA